jgi:hypothetical protein
MLYKGDAMNNKDEFIYYKYNFEFKDQTEIAFEIKLRLSDLSYIKEETGYKPDWTRLEYHQCSNCKLSLEQTAYCPIALNLTNIIPKFQSTLSYEKVFVTVETMERIYQKNTTIQQALGSMLGILMVTSGCPIMNILRPMVRLHLPFASLEETVFRSVSSYLLAQYFRNKKKEKTDWELKELLNAYGEIQIVNTGMAKRLKSISDKDASANAIVVLDVFAKELPFSISDGLKNLEYLYSEFM